MTKHFDCTHMQHHFDHLFYISHVEMVTLGLCIMRSKVGTQKAPYLHSKVSSCCSCQVKEGVELERNGRSSKFCRALAIRFVYTLSSVISLCLPQLAALSFIFHACFLLLKHILLL